MRDDVEALAEAIEDALSEAYGTFLDGGTPPGVAREIAPMLAAHVAAVRADAWDHGWLASKRHERSEGQPKMTLWPNPYRAALRPDPSESA